MNILQIGNTDLTGSRFNGYELHCELRRRGLESKYLVWEKLGTDPATGRFGAIPGRRWIDGAVRRVEKALAVQSLLYPSGFSLPLSREVRDADIIHLHLLHTAHLSLWALPLLARQKPLVWTLHDPWALTGHCIYPLTCERWKTGCGSCPMLDQPIAMRRDRTAFMWEAKRRLYAAADFDIVVSAEWMERLAEASPLTRDHRVHRIPFGVDLETYRPGSIEEAKRKLGIDPARPTIGFRATENPFKGLAVIKDALRRLAARDVCLITLEGRGLLSDLADKYEIRELGWVSASDAAAEAYRAMDVFLMPSVAESFGLMAIEAMASATPVIVTQGTPLAGLVDAPDCGVAVPQGDAAALAREIDSLLRQPEERRRRGRRGRELAEERYGFERYLQSTLTLYQAAIERRRGQ